MIVPPSTCRDARANTTFYDAQARHRRAASRWRAVCWVIAALMALMASFVLTPFVIVSAALLARTIHFIAPLPPSFWDGLQNLAASLADAQRAAFAGELTSAALAAATRSLSILLAPGMVLVLLAWRWLRFVLLRDGAIGIIQAIGMRSPREDDFEERQLVNVVEEMGIAAGMSRMRVSLLDHGAPNAVAVGLAPDSTTIAVTRSMLAILDRDQTQAAVGHLVASVANGDLKLSLETLAVAQTFGFLTTLLEAPLNASARSRLRQLRRVAKSGDTSADRATLVAAFCAGLDPDTISESGQFIDDLDRPGTRGFKSFLLHLRAMVLLPLFGVVLVAKLFMLITTMLIVVPMVGWMLRHRRYLADATAVQLTRNPDALARALAAMAPPPIEVGAHWAPHLFMVTPRGVSKTGTPLLLFGVQPPLRSRLERLRGMGARLAIEEHISPKPQRPRFPRLPDVGLGWQAVTMAVVLLILSPAVGFVAYLLGVASLFAVGVAAGAYWLALWVASLLGP